MKQHSFTASIVWTGNRGTGTATYKGYDRTWRVVTPGKPVIECSNDPLLGGNPLLHNPEDLLLSSLSACHMLWYLHLASNAGLTVLAYRDQPVGHAETLPGGAGRFVSAVLRPQIVLKRGDDVAVADAIHHEIHKVCFIARSVNFPVGYEASYPAGIASP